MINRDTHKELLQDIGALKREAEYWERTAEFWERDAEHWETQAKTLRIRNEQLLDDINILSAQLKIWKGTGL